MRIGTTLIKILLIFLLILSFSNCSLLKLLDKHLPSDKVLEQKFESDKDDLAKLVEMFRVDHEVYAISKYTTIDEKFPGHEKLSRERLIDYLNLLEKTGVSYIHRDSRNSNYTFYMEVSSVVVDDSDYSQIFVDEKGYVYSEVELSPTLESLDDSTKISGIAYKKLTNNWYLYYEQSISKPE